MRRQDSNVRPPGYEPGELPTAPLRDVLLHSAMLGCQNQCKSNAESLLFAETKPDFAGLFLKSAAKVRLFFELCKYFAGKSQKIGISTLLRPFCLAISELFSNFAHCICTVQYVKKLGRNRTMSISKFCTLYLHCAICEKAWEE